MQTMYATLETGGVGLFESPTGYHMQLDVDKRHTCYRQLTSPVCRNWQDFEPDLQCSVQELARL